VLAHGVEQIDTAIFHVLSAKDIRQSALVNQRFELFLVLDQRELPFYAFDLLYLNGRDLRVDDCSSPCAWRDYPGGLESVEGAQKYDAVGMRRG
jgi:hypothetical protein